MSDAFDALLQRQNEPCKFGGCGAIGCEGGHYCFNADGTRKPTPTSAELAEAFTKLHGHPPMVSGETQTQNEV